MSDTGKYVSPNELFALERSGTGRIMYDERGNALWVPFDQYRDRAAVEQALAAPDLALAEEPRQQRLRLEANPQGTVKGYDPYDSGKLGKDSYKKKKDLRALSRWIVAQKQTGRA